MKRVFFSLIFSLVTTLSIAQLFPPKSVDITLEANIDTTLQVQLDPIMMDSSTISGIPHQLGVVIALKDTVMVSSVHLKLANDTNVLFNGSIPFSTNNSQTTSYTLIRKNKILYLDFGSHTGSLNFVAETYTEDGQGGISTTITN